MRGLEKLKDTVKSHKKVDVFWYDITPQSSSWISQSSLDSELPHPVMVVTSGFVAREDPEFIWIAGSIQAPGEEDDEPTYSDVNVIPKGCIVAMMHSSLTYPIPDSEPSIKE